MNKKQKNRLLFWGRIAVQIIFFVFLPSLFSQAFGGVKEIVTAIGQRDVLSMSAFVTKLIVLVAVTIIFGRVFCGWACAFGALGDWIYAISQQIQKKCKKRLPGIPEKADYILTKAKYGVLVGILVLCYMQKGQLITNNSPWTVFSLLTARNISIGAYGIGIAFLLAILVGMAFCERFFCRFLCPMGAVFSLLPQLLIFQFKRSRENCIPNCQACKRNCPVKMKLQENPMQEGECIKCGRCVLTCPKKNISLGWERIKK